MAGSFQGLTERISPPSPRGKFSRFWDKSRPKVSQEINDSRFRTLHTFNLQISSPSRTLANQNSFGEPSRGHCHLVQDFIWRQEKERSLLFLALDRWGRCPAFFPFQAGYSLPWGAGGGKMYLVFPNKCSGFVTANNWNDRQFLEQSADEAEPRGSLLWGSRPAFLHVTLCRRGPTTPWEHRHQASATVSQPRTDCTADVPGRALDSDVPAAAPQILGDTTQPWLAIWKSLLLSTEDTALIAKGSPPLRARVYINTGASLTVLGAVLSACFLPCFPLCLCLSCPFPCLRLRASTERSSLSIQYNIEATCFVKWHFAFVVYSGDLRDRDVINPISQDRLCKAPLLLWFFPLSLTSQLAPHACPQAPYRVFCTDP